MDNAITDQSRPATSQRVPAAPTLAERQLHELTHQPYRDWCPICVQARGRQSPHLKKVDKRPCIQIDYAFVSDRNIQATDTPAADGRTRATILTAIDTATGLTLACVIQAKGKSEYSTAELYRFIQEAGRTTATLELGVKPLQTGQESSLRQLVSTVAERLHMPTRTSAAYSHQSQGAVERWHATLWALVRTLKLQLEKDYKVTVTPEPALFTWLVKHAAWLHNRYTVHSSGRTSFEQRWGVPYNRHIVKFGETVLFFVPTQTSKLQPAWVQGI